MADFYMQKCMRCGIAQDCYAYENGYICVECFELTRPGAVQTNKTKTTTEEGKIS